MCFVHCKQWKDPHIKLHKLQHIASWTIGRHCSCFIVEETVALILEAEWHHFTASFIGGVFLRGFKLLCTEALLSYDSSAFCTVKVAWYGLPHTAEVTSLFQFSWVNGQCSIQLCRNCGLREWILCASASAHCCLLEELSLLCTCASWMASEIQWQLKFCGNSLGCEFAVSLHGTDDLAEVKLLFC